MANWQEGSNPCGPQPWSGLVCADGWVVAVWLQDKGLAGPLTPDLVQVSHLAELRLSNNVLTGTRAQQRVAEADRQWHSLAGCHHVHAGLASVSLAIPLPALSASLAWPHSGRRSSEII